MIGLARYLRAWFADEDGGPTIEFVIWFPLFIVLLGSGFEAALLTTRQVMLIGAVDRTVRDLQLGKLGDPTHAELKADICENAGVIPNCATALNVELERVSTDDFVFRTGPVQCVDMDEETEPAVNVNYGAKNDLMLITVCAAVEPLLPNAGLGLRLPKINGGSFYALVAFSAFVVEPT